MRIGLSFFFLETPAEKHMELDHGSELPEKIHATKLNGFKSET